MGKKSKSRASAASSGGDDQVDDSAAGDKAHQPPFVLYKVEMNMALPPKALENVEDAVASKLEGRVMRYNEEVEGVVIAFRNVTFRSHKAHVFNELPTLHVGVNAELLVFSPVRGGHLRGVVNMVSSQHVGLLVLGAFNATLPANELPPSYSYSQGDEAWYGEGEGEGEEEGAVLGAGVEVDFIVTQLTVTNDLITITGTLRGEGTGPVPGHTVELAAPAVHFLPTAEEGAEHAAEEEGWEGQEQGWEEQEEQPEAPAAPVGRAKKRERRNGAARDSAGAADAAGDTPTAKRQRVENGAAVKEEGAVEAGPSAEKRERKEKKKKKKKAKGEGEGEGTEGAAGAGAGKREKKEKRVKKERTAGAV